MVVNAGGSGTVRDKEAVLDETPEVKVTTWTSGVATLVSACAVVPLVTGWLLVGIKGRVSLDLAVVGDRVRFRDVK